MRVQQLFELRDRVAIVTGGSRGLGLEIAQGLGEAGARVAITARREAWLGPAATALQEHGIEVAAFACDVSSEDEVATTVRQAIERFGHVDILVNNAGISWGAPPEQMPLDRWNQVLAVNATGAFLMSRAVVASMRAHRGGSIINVASVAGLVGTPPGIMDAVGYSASKGALISMTRDLAVKWAPDGIRVNAIAPGFFRTRMSEGILDRHAAAIEAATPMRRTGRDGELKGVAVFLASDASSYVTGQVIVVDGGMTVV